MPPVTPARREKALAINTAALTLGRLGSKLLVFLLVRFYTAVLTKEQFGTADLVTSVSNFLIPLACAGLSSGFFRFAAEAKSRREQSDVFSTGACILAVSSVLFALLSPLLMLFPYFGEYTVLILLYVLCANLHYLVSDFVRSQGNYKLFAWQGLLNTALNISFNLLFLLPLSMGVEGYVLSVVAADLCTSVFLIIYCRLWRFLRPGAVEKEQVQAMLRYCLPLIPATLCWWITNASDRYMVTHFCGEAANGLYAAAYKIPNLVTVASGIFLDAWQFSAVSEHSLVWQADSAEETVRHRSSLVTFFSRVFKGYASLLVLAAAGMILLCRPLARLLFAPEFVAAERFVPVLLLACVLSALSNFAGSVYMVEKRGGAMLATAALGAAVNIVLNLLLIPPYGALGAAVATALSYGVVFAVRLISARRSIPFSCAPVRLGISLGLLTLMAVLHTARWNGWVWQCCLLLALLLFFKTPALLHSLRRLFASRKQEQK